MDIGSAEVHEFIVASLERVEDFPRFGFPTAVQTKVVCTGGVLEVYVYGWPVLVGHDSARRAENGGRPRGRADPSPEGRSRPERTAERIRRLINANFWDTAGGKVFFDTFTFKDGAVGDVADLCQCNKAWDMFAKRWARYNSGVAGYDVSKFKAVAVVEFQKRGAVHYHVVSNRPWTKYEDLKALWGNGGIWVKKVESVDNIGAYLTPYFKKGLTDPRLTGRKAYLTIGRLDRPFALRGGRGQEHLRAVGIADLKPRYCASYETEWVGRVYYAQYNIRDTMGKE